MWLSQVVALLCMLVFVLYVVAENMVLIYCLHIVDLVLVFLLLWRVETLPELDAAQAPVLQSSDNTINIDIDQMEQLLKEHCVATQLYLENNLTLQMLAQAVGTNRSYLSQYFSRQGITYNIYINNQRINHFVSRCRELSAAGQDIPIQQLALESGFGSYRTFSRAFLLRTGQNVTEWLNGGVIFRAIARRIRKSHYPPRHPKGVSADFLCRLGRTNLQFRQDKFTKEDKS